MILKNLILYVYVCICSYFLNIYLKLYISYNKVSLFGPKLAKKIEEYGLTLFLILQIIFLCRWQNEVSTTHMRVELLTIFEKNLSAEMPWC